MTTISIILTYLAGLFGPCYVQANPIMYEPVPVEVVLAMKDIGDGPEHHFKLLPDGRLYVDQGQGWKRMYEPVPVEVGLAMKDIGDGPEHHFKLMPDGRLYVDQGQGWKRLRY